MSTMPVIDVERLRLTYGDFHALKALSFRCGAGALRTARHERGGEDLGITLQESGFSPDLTMKESVRLIGKLTQRTDSVDRVLDIAGLTDKAGTKVSQLCDRRHGLPGTYSTARPAKRD